MVVSGYVVGVKTDELLDGDAAGVADVTAAATATIVSKGGGILFPFLKH